MQPMVGWNISEGRGVEKEHSYHWGRNSYSWGPDDVSSASTRLETVNYILSRQDRDCSSARVHCIRS